MRLPRLIAKTLALAGAAAPPALAAEPDDGFFGGQYAVTLALSDVGGAPLAEPVAGQPFRVTVRLTDPASGQPVKRRHLAGWIRPVTARDGSCGAAARAYFSSERALPRDATDLDRALYAVRHVDGTVSIVDWEHSLASANILALAPVAEMDGAVVADPDAFGFRVPVAGGGFARIPAGAGAEPVVAASAIASTGATGGPALVAANGWIAQGAMLLPPGDAIPVMLAAPVKALAPALPDRDRLNGVVALTEASEAVVVGLSGARAAVAAPPGATAVAHAAAADALLFADGSNALAIVYGGSRRISAPLPAPARRVSVDRDGAFALAWSPDSGAVSIIEVATGAVVQAIALNRPPVDQPVREVAFAEGAAFLLLKQLDFVMVVDLIQARLGEPAAVRAVRIGPPVPVPPPGGGPYLIESGPGYAAGLVLALHPDLATAFPVMRESGNATAPMNGFRVRGARPMAMAELAGGLAEQAPGVFSAATVVARGGPHEIIVSAGAGQPTACARFSVAGDASPAGLVLRLDAQLVAADGGMALDLRLLDEDGTAQAFPQPLDLVLGALEGGWRTHVVAVPAGDGRLHATVSALPAGPVSVALAGGFGSAVTVEPTTVTAP